MSRLLRFTENDIQDIDISPWLEQKSEELRAIAKKWYGFIQQCGADVDMIFHDDYPIGCVDEAPFAYVNVFSKHVNVGFFYGAELPDPRRVLQGTGKRMRHVKLRSDTSYDEKAILTLIRHAYLDIKERLLLE